ncbi:MAG: tetratricopeptide repeat protein [Phycisphaerae bacterium]
MVASRRPQPLSAAMQTVKGDLQSEFRLGQHELSSRHYRRAMSLFWKTAAAGMAGARRKLGYMYYNGLGTPRNQKKAVHLWAKAAAQGDARAMYDLGVCYQLGRGCEPSYRLATVWFRRAAARNLAPAMCAIGGLYESGHYTGRSGRPEQSYPLAEKWYRRAAAKGFAPAMYAIGRLYATGRGAKRDPGRAVDWFRHAAVAGDHAAMRALSAAYQVGWGVPKNLERADKWLGKAGGKQFVGDLVDSLTQMFSEPLLIKKIPDGLDGRPSEIAYAVLHGTGKLKALGVAVRSDRAMAVMSESLVGEGADAPAIIEILARARGAGRRTPAILINGIWQIGGGLGPNSFIYGSETYRYSKKHDTWVPVHAKKKAK